MSPRDLVRLGIRRWKGFTSTVQTPAPYHVPTEHEGWATHIPDNVDRQAFHDLTAVLAGSKPAATAPLSFLQHPTWRHIRHAALERGMKIANAGGGEFALGHPDHVDRVVAADKLEGPERSRAYGEALGYHPDAIEEFVHRVQSGGNHPYPTRPPAPANPPRLVPPTTPIARPVKHARGRIKHTPKELQAILQASLGKTQHSHESGDHIPLSGWSTQGLTRWSNTGFAAAALAQYHPEQIVRRTAANFFVFPGPETGKELQVQLLAHDSPAAVLNFHRVGLHWENDQANADEHLAHPVEAPTIPDDTHEQTSFPEDHYALSRSGWRGTTNGYWIDHTGATHDTGEETHDEWVANRDHHPNESAAMAAGWQKVHVIPAADLVQAHGHKPLTNTQREALGLIAIRHRLSYAAHTIPGQNPTRVRLARRKADPDEKAFLTPIWRQWQAWRKAVADNERRRRADVYEGVPPIMDDTTRGVFADWLAERGDPREAIVRGHINAIRGTIPANAHPEASPAGGASHLTVWPHQTASGYGEGAPAGAWDFTRDLIHPGRAAALYPGTGSERSDSLPMIFWRHSGRSRNIGHPIMFRAPVTREDYFRIADSMPEAKRAQWEAYARNYGWERPKPTKLRRNEGQQMGTAGAVSAGVSANHDTRTQIVKTILAQAGLTRARVASVLAHDGKSIRPGVAAILADANPAVATFAAAWIGMLTGQKRTTVFTPGDGEDTLHVVDSPHPPEHVGQYLQRSGVPRFSLEAHAGGTRAFVVNPSDLIDVPTAARGVQGTVQTLRGTATGLGSGGLAKDARKDYRSIIDGAEGAVS